MNNKLDTLLADIKCKICKKKRQTHYNCSVCDDCVLCGDCLKKYGHPHQMEKLGMSIGTHLSCPQMHEESTYMNNGEGTSAGVIMTVPPMQSDEMNAGHSDPTQDWTQWLPSESTPQNAPDHRQPSPQMTPEEDPSQSFSGFAQQTAGSYSPPQQPLPLFNEFMQNADLPSTSGSQFFVKQPLQKVMITLSSEQESEIKDTLQNNPELMAAFIREHQKYKEQIQQSRQELQSTMPAHENDQMPNPMPNAMPNLEPNEMANIMSNLMSNFLQSPFLNQILNLSPNPMPNLIPNLMPNPMPNPMPNSLSIPMHNMVNEQAGTSSTVQDAEMSHQPEQYEFITIQQNFQYPSPIPQNTEHEDFTAFEHYVHEIEYCEAIIQPHVEMESQLIPQFHHQQSYHGHSQDSMPPQQGAAMSNQVIYVFNRMVHPEESLPCTSPHQPNSSPLLTLPQQNVPLHLPQGNGGVLHDQAPTSAQEHQVPPSEAEMVQYPLFINGMSQTSGNIPHHPSSLNGNSDMGNSNHDPSHTDILD